MRIHMPKDEAITVVIDGTCGFIIWGERNEEGTMVIKSELKDALQKDGE